MITFLEKSAKTIGGEDLHFDDELCVTQKKLLKTASASVKSHHTFFLLNTTRTLWRFCLNSKYKISIVRFFITTQR